MHLKIYISFFIFFLISFSAFSQSNQTNAQLDSIKDFNDNQKQFLSIINDYNWNVRFNNLILKDCILKGIYKDSLYVSQINYNMMIPIKDIETLHYKTSSYWLAGLVLGIPAGGIVGALTGTAIETGILNNHGEFSGLAGLVLGALVGAVTGGIVGTIIFDKMNDDIKIQLEKNDLDKIEELNKKTYYTLLTLKKQNENNSGIIDTNSIKSKSGQKELVNNINTSNSKSMDYEPEYSIGLGFFSPSDYTFNVNIMPFYDFGFGFNGYPFKSNSDYELVTSYRFLSYYRWHHGKHTYDNLGIFLGTREELKYPLERKSVMEYGVYYEFNAYGFYMQAGTVISSFFNSYRYSPVHIQIGYNLKF